MGRTPRDEAAAGLAARVVDAEPPGGRALVLEDARPDVAAALARDTGGVATWSRFVGEADWPPLDDAYAWVGIRLPKSRRELEMLLAIAAAALEVDGRLIVYGANDEGVRSVARRLGPEFGSVETLATGGHCRVVGARRSGQRATRGGRREDWRATSQVDLGSGPREWVSYPGVFAHGRLDEGTALLLAHLPAVPPDARVLDYGAGSGFLAAGLLGVEPTAQVTALEPDRLAAAAAAENVPEATVRTGRGWTALAGCGPWRVVVSNPPYHHGTSETMREIEAFLSGASAHLERGGVLRCVVQRRFPFRKIAEPAGLRSVCTVADGGPYRVWEAVA